MNQHLDKTLKQITIVTKVFTGVGFWIKSYLICNSFFYLRKAAYKDPDCSKDWSYLIII